MLALSRLKAFTSGATFAKARQMDSAVVRSEIAFEASIWHQRGKEEELSSKERRLEGLQKNKHRNAEDRNVHSFASRSLKQTTESDHITQSSRRRTQKTQRACELIHARLIETSHLISRSSIIKKVMLLNISIREDAKIQLRRRCFIFSTLSSTSDRIAIEQYHKSQWDLRWENYKIRIADINAISAQRSHLFKKTIKMRDDLQKVESTLATHIRIERIGLNAYLHFRNVSSANSLRCDCEWSHQTVKHILMHCSNWTHLRSSMLRDVDDTDYRIIVSTTKSLKAAAKMMMKTKLLKQFRVARALIL